MRLQLVVIGSVLAGLLGPGCATPPPPPPPVIPEPDVGIRPSFDDDPSEFIGRFVANGVDKDDLDETNAVQTRCTEHIGYKVKRASMTFDKYLRTSKKASASLGIAPFFKIGGGTQSSSVARIKYKLTHKMVAFKKDAAAYDRCCKDQTNGCPNRFIGEFWRGTGVLMEVAGAQSEISGGGEYKQASGSFEYKDGWAWKKATEFEDVYFAFKLHQGGLGAGIPSDASCSWADNIPRSPDGKYFVGVSPAVFSEGIARTKALVHGREQVINYLGTYIQSASRSVTHATEGFLEDRNVVASASDGIASMVADEKWCPAEKITGPDGVKYVTKVLMYFPQAQEKQAAKMVLDRLMERLDTTGELTKKKKQELEAAKQAIDKAE